MRDEIFAKGSITGLLCLFVCNAVYKLHVLYITYNVHGITNIRDYIFTKQSLPAKFAKISSRKKYRLYSILFDELANISSSNKFPLCETY